MQLKPTNPFRAKSVMYECLDAATEFSTSLDEVLEHVMDTATPDEKDVLRGHRQKVDEVRSYLRDVLAGLIG